MRKKVGKVGEAYFWYHGAIILTNGGERMAKVAWKDIYKDFRDRHPNLKKEIVDWRPYDFLTIMLQLSSGERLVYEYITKDVKFIR